VDTLLAAGADEEDMTEEEEGADTKVEVDEEDMGDMIMDLWEVDEEDMDLEVDTEVEVVGEGDMVLLPEEEVVVVHPVHQVEEGGIKLDPDPRSDEELVPNTVDEGDIPVPDQGRGRGRYRARVGVGVGVHHQQGGGEVLRGASVGVGVRWAGRGAIRGVSRGVGVRRRRSRRD